MAYIEMRNVNKVYGSKEVEVKALNNASFTIEKGELVVILGPSGAGKTTCLNILGGMDQATDGEVLIDGTDITKLKNKEIISYRRHDIGFVFQFYNLIQNLTALENVELAVQLCKDHLDPIEILNRVGLSSRIHNFPSQLSGGEQQRVAIARALAKNPKLLLCDEPTGALDYKTGKQILALLEHEARHYHITVIIITHNSAIAPMADKVIKFKNGSVEDVIINEHPKKVEEIEW
ncbi:MAG: ABC transporter ATP-binding protein [Bacilli bacterium]|nr:ABC transporter ATP-binding protein [Bacilli bacterium]